MAAYKNNYQQLAVVKFAEFKDKTGGFTEAGETFSQFKTDIQQLQDGDLLAKKGKNLKSVSKEASTAEKSVTKAIEKFEKQLAKASSFQMTSASDIKDYCVSLQSVLSKISAKSFASDVTECLQKLEENADQVMKIINETHDQYQKIQAIRLRIAGAKVYAAQTTSAGSPAATDTSGPKKTTPAKR